MDHEIAVDQMDGFGGVISFEIDGDLWRAAKFVDSVCLPYIAPSLGGVESLIEQPTVVSYWDQVNQSLTSCHCHPGPVLLSSAGKDPVPGMGPR